MSERIEQTAIITAKPGNEDELAFRIGELAALTRQEPGCVEFQVFRDLRRPDRFVLWEIFDNAEALREHLAMEYTKAYFARALAAGSEIIEQRLLP